MDITKRFDCIDPTCHQKIEYQRIIARRVAAPIDRTPARASSIDGAPVIVYLTCPNGHEYPYNVSPSHGRPPALTANGYGWPH